MVINKLERLFQALVKRIPSSVADSQSAVATSPFASGETDEAQEDGESSLSSKVSSAATGISSSAGTSTAGLGGVSTFGNLAGVLQESGAFMSKSVEALAKQLEVHSKLLQLLEP